MSAKQVVTIFGAAAAAFVGWFQYHYNVHKRKVLDSNQSIFYNSNSFHTITALVPSGELKIMFDHSDSEKLKERVDRLHDAISNAGGKRIYTGRTLTPGAVSARVPTDLIQGVRIVLVSQWESFDQFKNFRGYDSIALIRAAKYEHFNVVQYLLQHGEADPSITDKYGLGPLHYAAASNQINIDLIKVLLENMAMAGNYINQKSKKGGGTALDAAYGNASAIKQQIVDLIIKYGGKRGSEL